MNYATTQDVITLFRPLRPEEQAKVENLIPIICSDIRAEAHRQSKDFDAMISEDANLALVAKSVVVDVVGRCLMTPVEGSAGVMSQYTESAGGYSVSGSYLNPGGGVFIKKSEWKRLGLRRQTLGGIDLCR
ncbi:MAG: hypothetical protein IJU01_00470 [Lachnospiraceae bacterium]|nr:hypothetical protein [Lachnospiraceae bacterium]